MTKRVDLGGGWLKWRSVAEPWGEIALNGNSERYFPA
jgi:hypothetical protein